MPPVETRYSDEEMEQITQSLLSSNCVSIIGLSNMGKSTLMRSLSAIDLAARYQSETGREVVFAYIDCNGMLELSGQGFYELVLRTVRDSIPSADAALLSKLDTYYQQAIESDSPLIVPLSFNNALTAFIEEGGRDLVLLLDEFDEAFDSLDGRVFLNLRALRDRYPRNLLYVTATVRRLGFKRGDEQTAEFVELSTAHTHSIGPLDRVQADEMAYAFSEDAGMDRLLSRDELDFLWEQAGGHPGLTMAVISKINELATSDLATIAEALPHDGTVRSECNRLWSQLGADERETLLSIVVGTTEKRLERALQSLSAWGLVRAEEDDISTFCSLLADFVRRQATVQRELPGGLWIDEDAGDVWVGGLPIEALTELEFKLLQLLFHRRNKLTDKYQIVERVWGVDYLDDIDDARIEKLVSRLRSKIEPDPANPQYIITIRGRGYKLNAAT